MSEMLDDGVDETFDRLLRVATMEGARVLEAILARRKASLEAARGQDERARMQAQARLRAEAAQSRFRLGPVMNDAWWARADPETVAQRYAEAKSWDGVDPTFKPFTDRIEEEAKARFGVSPEELRAAVEQPSNAAMGVDEARAIAVSAAPQWYQVHERIASGEMPLDELDEAGKTLVSDMTQLRDTGTLDTNSAREEWGRYLGRDDLPDVQAVNDLWDSTEDQRAEVSVTAHEGGVEPAMPMTVADAKEFAKTYAPEWFVFGQEQALAEHEGDPVARAQVESQGRYAMEVLRDTGALAHPYAQKMREELESHPEVDTVDNGKPVREDARVQYGASESSRLLSAAEASEMIQDHAPQWYRDAIAVRVGPDGGLTATGRAMVKADLRADMTRLRDTGRLDSTHAKRVWFETRGDSGDATPAEVWSATANEKARQTAPALSAEDRVRLGGPDPKRHVDVVYEGPVTGRKKKDRAGAGGWDSVSRREARAEMLEAKFGADVAQAYKSSSVMSSKPGGETDSAAVHHKAGKAPKVTQSQVQRQRM